MEEEGSAGRKQKSTGGGGASLFLANLPSRGTFCSTAVTSNSNLGTIREYICEHDTSPPEGQLIETNQTNILIRALTNNKQKSDANSKEAKGRAMAEGAKGKRVAEKPADGKNSAKRAHVTLDSRSSHQDGSSSRASGKDFQTLTVERLRAILKEKGLPTKGRKDELIARLRSGKGNEADVKKE